MGTTQIEHEFDLVGSQDAISMNGVIRCAVHPIFCEGRCLRWKYDTSGSHIPKIPDDSSVEPRRVQSHSKRIPPIEQDNLVWFSRVRASVKRKLRSVATRRPYKHTFEVVWRATRATSKDNARKNP